MFKIGDKIKLKNEVELFTNRSGFHYPSSMRDPSIIFIIKEVNPSPNGGINSYYVTNMIHVLDGFKNKLHWNIAFIDSELFTNVCYPDE